MTGRMRSALLVATAMIAGCESKPPPAAVPATGMATGEVAALDVAELAATEAAERMRSGALSSRALTQAYLDRIARIDKAGPTLNAVIELNPDALRDADALDRERGDGKVRGPLHGIPVLIKDNIDTGDRMLTTAGSLALAGAPAGADAFLVTRLRAAGAVILGKTNLSEWANFRSTNSTSGWSSRGGQTRNAYALDRNPCGTSSGTASAVAASLAAVGVGTETDGSILCPAAMGGLVGMKPTVGLVSRNGIIPISITQDTAGPMGRSVADVAMLLNALAGVDRSDPAGIAAEGRIPPDYSTSLRGDALAGKRIGVLRQAMGYHPALDAVTERAIAALEGGGAELVDVEVPTWRQWRDAEFEVLLYEFKHGLNAYLAASDAPHATLEALIAWNSANADESMPIFGQEIFEKAQAKGPLTDAAYLEAKAKARRLARDEGLLAVLENEGLAAVIAPSTAPAFLTDPVLGDHFVGAGYGIAAVAGTPSITVPMGEVRGLPVGLAFMGRAYSEAELLGFAFAFEQATRARKAPRYLPSLEP